MTAEEEAAREESHTAWCDSPTPHTWRECTRCGWDEHGVYFKDVAVCDNCGGDPVTVTTDSGRFCGQPCAEAYDLR